MARLPNLNGLKFFEATARHLSVGKAAAELNVTQTAVSHQLSRLQRELGLDLLQRNGRGVELTAAGKTLLPHVRAAFDELRLGASRLQRSQGSRTVTLSTTTTFALKWLVPRLSGFQKMHPDIDLRLTTTLRMIDFRHDDVDAGIRWGLGDWPFVHTEKMMEDDIFPVCAPSLLASNPLKSPLDLANHTLLHDVQNPDLWQYWLTGTGTKGIDAASGTTLDFTAVVLGAAIDVLGVAIGRSALVDGDLAAGRLVAPLDRRLPSGAAFYLVMPERSRKLKDVRAFREWLFHELEMTDN